MYEYIFVETSLGGVWSRPQHQETIQEYDAEGWRFVQVVPLNYDGHGKPGSFEIIFERPIKVE
jgi:hypothetical protein